MSVAACDRCTELQAAYDAFQAESQELEQELEAALKAEQQVAKSVQEKYERVSSTLTSERESHRVAVSQLHAQVSSLQSDLASSNAQLNSLHASKRLLEQNITDVNERLRRAEAALQDAQDRAEVSEEREIMAKSELDEERSRRVEQERRHAQEIEELREDAKRNGGAGGSGSDSLTSSDANEEIALLQEEITLLREEKDALERDIADMDTDLGRVQDENEELTRQVEEMTERLVAAEEEARKWKLQAGKGDGAEVAASANGTASDSGVVAELRARVSELEASLEQSNQELLETCDEAATRITDLEAELQQLREEYATYAAQMQEELAKAQAQSQNPGANANDAQTRIAELEAEITARDERIAQLEAGSASSSEVDAAERKRLQAQVTDLQKQLRQSHTTISDLESRLSSEQHDAMLKLEQTIAKLMADVQAAENERAQLQAKCAEQSTQCIQQQQAMERLTKELADAHSLATASADERDSVAARQLAELSQQLQLMQAKLADSDANNELLKSERAAAQATAAIADAALAASQERFSTLERRTSSSPSTATLEAEIAALKQEREALQKELERMGQPPSNSPSPRHLDGDGSESRAHSPKPNGRLSASPSPPSDSDPDHVSSSPVLFARRDEESVNHLRSTLDSLHLEVAHLPPPASDTLKPIVTDLTTTVSTSLTTLDQLQQQLADSTDREVELMQRLQAMQPSNIRVFARVRPMMPHEQQSELEENLLQYPSQQQIAIRADAGKRIRNKNLDAHQQRGGESEPPSPSSSASASPSPSPADYTNFAFDHVFLPDSTQDEVFSSVADIIVPVLNGHRSCILAYGQTGSGKTYTMSGREGGNAYSAEEAGVTYRAMEALFRGMAQRSASYKYEVRVTLVELYNEQFNDLLVGATAGRLLEDNEEALPGDDADDQSTTDEVEPSSATTNKPKLVVKKGTHGMYVDGASRRVVSNVGEVLALLRHGNGLRQKAATQMNTDSSRSHLLLLVDLIGVHQSTQVSSYGRLSLVDLAGSERIKASGASGARLVEATYINRSLSALADVFQALTDSKAKHVPFRNSRLTFLLQDSFKGPSRTLMFVNLSPAAMHAGETLCSLQFASRARQVKLSASTAAVDGLSVKYKKMMATQAEAFNKKEQAYLTQIKQFKQTLKAKEKDVEQLKQQAKTLQEKVAEVERRADRAESDRRSLTLKQQSAPTAKDRKAELEEEKKWNALQNEISTLQGKIEDAKAAYDRLNNEWREKYGALELKLKDSNERMRLLRLEANDKRKGTGTMIDESGNEVPAENSEITTLRRRMNLLELENRRLRATRTAATATLRLQKARLSREGTTTNEDASTIPEGEQNNGEQSAVPTRPRSASDDSNASTGSGTTTTARRTSSLRPPSVSTHATKNNNGDESPKSAGSTGSATSRNNTSTTSTARRSLLPPSRSSTSVASSRLAAHRRTTSKDSNGSRDDGTTTANSSRTAVRSTAARVSKVRSSATTTSSTRTSTTSSSTSRPTSAVNASRLRPTSTATSSTNGTSSSASSSTPISPASSRLAQQIAKARLLKSPQTPARGSADTNGSNAVTPTSSPSKLPAPRSMLRPPTTFSSK